MFQDGWKFFRTFFIPLNILVLFSFSGHLLLGDFIFAGMFWGLLFYYVPGVLLIAFSEYVASKKKKNIILVPLLTFIYFWVNLGIVTYVVSIMARGRDPFRYTPDSYVFMILIASIFAIFHLIHYLLVYKFVYTKKELEVL